MARQRKRPLTHLSTLRFGAAMALLALAAAFSAPPATALSELQREDVPPEASEEGKDVIERQPIPPPQGVPVPLPDPIVIPQDPPASQAAEPDEDADEPIPDVLYDVELLPEPVRRMRGLIMEACLTGDMEQLRPLISTGEGATQFSFGGVTGDPIEFLRSLSGDDEGQEILAILYEVLAAGYVHVGQQTPDEVYIWPYFFAVPLDALDKRQRVELFKIVTAGDYEDMKNYGAYIFYRVAISPEGRWMSFVAGD